MQQISKELVNEIFKAKMVHAIETLTEDQRIAVLWVLGFPITGNDSWSLKDMRASVINEMTFDR